MTVYLIFFDRVKAARTRGSSPWIDIIVPCTRMEASTFVPNTLLTSASISSELTSSETTIRIYPLAMRLAPPMALLWYCSSGLEVNGTGTSLNYYYYSPRPYAFRSHINEKIVALPNVTVNSSSMVSWATLTIREGTLFHSSSRVDAYFGKDGKVLAFYGSAPPEDYQDALRTVRYKASDELSLKQRPNRHTRTLTLTVTADDNAKVVVEKKIYLRTARTCINDKNPVQVVV